MEIPEHRIIGHIGSRMSLMAPIHRRELDRIADEEDREVIEDKILDALFGVELGSPTANIPHSVTGPFFAAHS